MDMENECRYRWYKTLGSKYIQSSKIAYYFFIFNGLFNG